MRLPVKKVPELPVLVVLTAHSVCICLMAANAVDALAFR
ncbi:hypothetical protein EW15_1643 [Prochlorococcus sp. MIT 0801]|nr:hypothetical protein EW15_1643 [Prochlorococcus sp. MIT 0801]